MNVETKYKRILLKVSGEALAGAKGTGFDDETMRSICGGIKQIGRASCRERVLVTV